MRRRLLPLAVWFTALVPSALAAQADSRPGIAVFPFANGGSFGANREDLEALSIGIQQMLLTELSQNKALRIVERSQLRALLEEQQLATAGQVDAQTAARVGKVVGARYVVTGVFIDLNGNFRLDGRIVDVETSEILKTAQVRDRRDNLYELLFDLAAKITDDVDLPPLPASVREERREREIPTEAVTLFSRAQVYQDAGRKERAVELYRQIAERFPQMTEAREALRQLSSEG